MCKNLTIRMRLIAVLTMLALLLLAVGGTGLASLGKTHSALRTVYEERLLSLGHLDHMMRILLRNQLAIYQAANSDPATLPVAIEQIERDRDLASKLWQEYSVSFITDEEKEMAERFDAARKHFMLDALAPALVAGKAGDADAMRALVHGPVAQMFPRIRLEMDKLIAYQLDHAKAQYGLSEKSYARLHALVVVLLAIGVMLAAGSGWWLVRGVTLPMNHALGIAQAVAKGDLSLRIDVRSNDETGKLLAALKDMNSSLAAMVGNVLHAADTVTGVSSRIASGSMVLSERTEVQAASLEEISASMEELAATVRRNAGNAWQANQFAQGASHVATRGGAAVFQLIEKIGAVTDWSRNGTLSQTHLQDLNASAEAAHATMNEVVQAVHRVSQVINEITAASHEQCVGIDQVNAEVIRIDSATQQNTAMAGQAAAAAALMQQQAAELSKAVSVFRLNAKTTAPKHHSAQSLNTPHTHQISLA